MACCGRSTSDRRVRSCRPGAARDDVGVRGAGGGVPAVPAQPQAGPPERDHPDRPGRGDRRAGDRGGLPTSGTPTGSPPSRSPWRSGPCPAVTTACWSMGGWSRRWNAVPGRPGGQPDRGEAALCRGRAGGAAPGRGRGRGPLLAGVHAGVGPSRVGRRRPGQRAGGALAERPEARAESQTSVPVEDPGRMVAVPGQSPSPGRPRPPVVLEAVLERITYANEDTGYTIARVATERTGPDLLTVVGPLLGAQVGESLRLTGRWSSHPKYGKQFEVRLLHHGAAGHDPGHPPLPGFGADQGDRPDDGRADGRRISAPTS